MALPKCGLYRTGAGLPGKEAAIGPGGLIYFHNHSKQGPPIALLPERNTFNKWAFSERGYLVDGEGADGFIAALVALPAQGFYAVTRRIQLVGDQVLLPRRLVQIGYNRRGHVILFPAEFRGNGFWFPEQGFRFESLGIFESLAPTGFDAPAAAVDKATLH